MSTNTSMIVQKPMTRPASSTTAHLQRGVRRVLESASIYALFKNLIRSRAAQQRFVDEMIPAFPGARILDIGCGDGWVLEFLKQDVQYAGYDLNPDYIERARAQHGDRARFFCANVSAESAPELEGERFDIVLALGLLHHLSDPEVSRLCESARAHLKPGGLFVTFDGVYTVPQSPVARFIISRDRGRAVRTAEGYLALVRPHFTKVSPQIRTDLLRIPYTHLIMHCTAE